MKYIILIILSITIFVSILSADNVVNYTYDDAGNRTTRTTTTTTTTTEPTDTASVIETTAIVEPEKESIL